jgi:hypothetical protein
MIESYCLILIFAFFDDVFSRLIVKDWRYWHPKERDGANGDQNLLQIGAE